MSSGAGVIIPASLAQVAAEIAPQVATVIPYPTPQDRVMVAVYDMTTGDIRQTVKCQLQDMENQHTSWPGCGYLEYTDQTVNPRDYVVDLTTMTLVPRVTPSAADLALQESNLVIASRVSSFVSGGVTFQMSDVTMRDLMVASMIGGLVDGKSLTAAQALQALHDYAALRDANATKLDGLLLQMQNAKYRASVAAIIW